jgi:hypothetical protein
MKISIQPVHEQNSEKSPSKINPCIDLQRGEVFGQLGALDAVAQRKTNSKSSCRDAIYINYTLRIVGMVDS